MKEIFVNGKAIHDYQFPVGIFDTVTLPKMKKSYKILFSKNGKLEAKEAKETETKVNKIVGKKILPGNKQQINLFDGTNILSKEKVKINDSVLFSLKDKKIVKIIPLKEKAEVYIINGKHLGETGTIDKIENNESIVQIGKKSVNIKLNNIFVTG